MLLPPFHKARVGEGFNSNDLKKILVLRSSASNLFRKVGLQISWDSNRRYSLPFVKGGLGRDLVIQSHYNNIKINDDDKNAQKSDNDVT